MLFQLFIFLCMKERISMFYFFLLGKIFLRIFVNSLFSVRQWYFFFFFNLVNFSLTLISEICK